jgi:sodium-independent sulfate anion transporter 11
MPITFERVADNHPSLMLIPQSLSYAKIATIPVEYGLMSSWLPPTIYAIMGSTKGIERSQGTQERILTRRTDLSTGPTSLLGLTTAEVVNDLTADGYTPEQVASAVAMCIGFYGIIVGFLNLGFLLEFISLPILSGFISAVAITIGLGQVPSLLGEEGGSDSTAGKIHDMFSQLPQANGYACGIGFGGLVFMTILDKAGKRWGDKYKAVWLLSITRAFLCLVLFTGISYAVNGKYGKDDDSYLFEVVKVSGKGIVAPKMPPSSLISAVFPRSIAAFIGPILEHIAIARAFGVKNNYVSDQTQELCYFGITNFVNSFFHSMGVGGAMSRTSVNSACKVKSPLSGVVTTAVILVCIFKLTGVLYWIPKATLAAIIITAVWPLINPPSVFYRYWKTSLADFVSSMLAFWVCLFVNTEAGLGAAVGFNIAYVLLRQTFTSVKSISSSDRKELSELRQSLDPKDVMPTNIPDDLRIFRFHESFFFPNAYGIKTSILNNIKTHHSPAYSTRNGAEAERIWSVQGERQVARLRKKMKITDPDSLPPMNVVVFDLTKCNHLDATACTQLKQLVVELKLYSGKQIELRFTGASEYVRTRMERSGFEIVESTEATPEDEENGVPQHFTNLSQALSTPRRDGDDTWRMNMDEKKGETVETVEDIGEKV